MRVCMILRLMLGRNLVRFEECFSRKFSEEVFDLSIVSVCFLKYVDFSKEFVDNLGILKYSLNILINVSHEKFIFSIIHLVLFLHGLK